MDGVQHNTYDVEFYGPNSMCSTWYLAALRAMGRMADAMDDPGLARDCDRIFQQGSKWIDANLFNGEYYVQQIRGIPLDKIATGLREGMGSKDTMDPQFQVGDGCFCDQLIGQLMATISGLGDLLDPVQIDKTLQSIYRYNYKRSLAHHASVQRVYALNDEAGLVIVDFTKGSRPEVPMPYYAEIWSGLEYSVAALMISHGMADKGVEIIRSTRSRYDGEKANPYDETEYGRHYTRPMASWAAIPVLSGFLYDARAQSISLLPRINTASFRCFWSTPSAWGNFEVTPHALTLTPAVGAVSLKQLTIPSTFKSALGSLKATSAGRTIAHTAASSDAGVLLQFSSSIEVDSNNPLCVQA
jgi:uncharacterized protein (DUF608 family)